MIFLKNNVAEIKKELKKKTDMVAMLAPSYVAEFETDSFLNKLRELGFDKIVELTFGAKMINREYHRILKYSKELVIASVCPGIVEIVKLKYPKFEKNLIKVDSPMVAMAKICKKFYPEHKVIFLSPCEYKKIECDRCRYVDYVLDYKQLKDVFLDFDVKGSKKTKGFDSFYNEYTKIYPLAGGLSKTAHLKGILKENEILKMDGIGKVMKFLDNPDKKIKFIDATFCAGGCIGGPCLTNGLTVEQRRKKVLEYLKKIKCKDIPEKNKGLIEKAKGIKFTF